MKRPPQFSPAWCQQQRGALQPGKANSRVVLVQFPLFDSLELNEHCWLMYVATRASVMFSPPENPSLEDVYPRVLQNMVQVCSLLFVFLFFFKSTHDVALASSCNLPFEFTCWVLPRVLSFVIKAITFIMVSYFDVLLYFPMASLCFHF